MLEPHSFTVLPVMRRRGFLRNTEYIKGWRMLVPFLYLGNTFGSFHQGDQKHWPSPIGAAQEALDQGDVRRVLDGLQVNPSPSIPDIWFPT